MERFSRLHCLLRATKPLSSSSKGAHTDVLRFDEERLLAHLNEAEPERLEQNKALAQTLAQRYVVKKGKIQFFSMALTGEKLNHIKRSLLSWTFGPVGYNFMPTYEKVISDAQEATRLVPYLGFGGEREFMAPDFLNPELDLTKGFEANSDSYECLDTFFEGFHETKSTMELLESDPHSRVHANLSEFQEFLRLQPLSADMEQRFAEFFESPITVGLRDTLRWFKGSRHPEFGWQTAKSLINTAFEHFGRTNFLPREITYYTYDTDLAPSELQNLINRNMRVSKAFSTWIESQIPTAAQEAWKKIGPEKISFDLLDFYTSYPLFEVEPYTGLLSTATARMALRASLALFCFRTGLDEPKTHNHNLHRAPMYHANLHAFLDALDVDVRKTVLERLAQALVEHEHRTHWQHREDKFEAIPRTYYTFQELAYACEPGFSNIAVHTLQDLPEDCYTRYPDLAEQLLVFFTLIYRHFADTGFIADLRPRDAGRDIFIYGIWGYMTENLLIVEEEGPNGPRARVSFIDNRDQFKEYRAAEDRKNSLGLAKYALHFIHPIVEPALLRSVGIFAVKVADQTLGRNRPSSIAEHALDFTRKLCKDAIDGAFQTTQATADELIDDLHQASLRLLKNIQSKRKKPE